MLDALLIHIIHRTPCVSGYASYASNGPSIQSVVV